MIHQAIIVDNKQLSCGQCKCPLPLTLTKLKGLAKRGVWPIVCFECGAQLREIRTPGYQYLSGYAGYSTNVGDGHNEEYILRTIG